MATNDSINTATGATSTVLAGAGVGTAPTFSDTPTVTSLTLGSGTALSNYVEGTWTPTIDGSTPGTTTYTSQNGYYTRIGNLVFIQGQIIITAATGTGNVIIAGLPFTIKSQTNGDSLGVFQDSGAWTWPVGSTQIICRAILNTQTLQPTGIGTALASAFLQMTNAAATFRISAWYQI